ncbi:MAG: DUF1850 domain-containing protein [Alkalilacustris sp.]
MTVAPGGAGPAPRAARLPRIGAAALMTGLALGAARAEAPPPISPGPISPGPISPGPVLPSLVVTDPDGTVLAELPLGPDGRWCLSWAHSVTGGAVADCFRLEEGAMLLERSFLHDFAAGLGTLPGRGTLHSAEGGGYWIEGIDTPLPDATLPLRVGRPGVDHSLASGAHGIALSRLAPGQRVLIRPHAAPAPPAAQDPAGASRPTD